MFTKHVSSSQRTITLASAIAAATTISYTFPTSSPFASTSPFASASTSTTKCDQRQNEEEHRSFAETLKHHRNQFSHYKQKWDWHNANSRIPTISWPLNIPDDSEVKGLQFDLAFCHKRKLGTSSSSTSNSENESEGESESEGDDRYCSNLQFRVASHMLLQPEVNVQKQGLKLVQTLAELGHADSICAYATILNDGRAGIEPNPSAAVSWWKNASDNYEHIQSTYEMGVALYTGEGVAEDEVLAVEYFRKSAESGHAGAAYMLGDCLLDGVGVERDRAEALEWLLTAAELGHRGARSRVLAVLEKKEGMTFGSFTDASRQTLLEKSDEDEEEVKVEKEESFTSGKKRDAQEKTYSTRPVTLEHRYTIGGGAKNPVVLARRRTIVTESRQNE